MGTLNTIAMVIGYIVLAVLVIRVINSFLPKSSSNVVIRGPGITQIKDMSKFLRSRAVKRQLNELRKMRQKDDG